MQDQLEDGQRQRSPRTPLEPGEFRDLVREGMDAHENGDHEHAITCFQNALCMDETDGLVWSQLASAFEGLYRWEEAEEARKTGLAHEEFGRDFFFLAALQDHVGKLEEAETNVRRSIELDPTNGEALLLFARLMERKIGADAREHYE